MVAVAALPVQVPAVVAVVAVPADVAVEANATDCEPILELSTSVIVITFVVVVHPEGAVVVFAIASVVIIPP